jgi:hypothetical protein
VRNYLIVTTIFLDAIAGAQLVRLLMRWPVTIDGFAVPIWASGIAAIVAGALAIWGTRLILRTRSTTTPA